MIEQEGKALVDRWCFDGMVVVEHERDIARQRREGVERTGQDDFERRRRGTAEWQQPLPGTGMERVERRADIAPEARRVIVAPVAVARQALSKVVLPLPAGAAINVNLRRVPASSQA
jgi:hypothetical protein